MADDGREGNERNDEEDEDEDEDKDGERGKEKEKKVGERERERENKPRTRWGREKCSPPIRDVESRDCRSPRGSLVQVQSSNRMSVAKTRKKEEETKKKQPATQLGQEPAEEERVKEELEEKKTS